MIKVDVFADNEYFRRISGIMHVCQIGELYIVSVVSHADNRSEFMRYFNKLIHNLFDE